MLSNALAFANLDGKVDFSDLLNAAQNYGRTNAIWDQGDFNYDGTVDFAVSNNGGPAELWRNHIDPGASWIAFTLVGTKSNRDGIGTRITVRTGTLTQFQQKSGGGSYLSSSDPRVFFGLGDAHKVDSVDVMWPSGRTEKFKDLTADQFVILKEGAGIVGANDGAKTKQRDSSKASRGAE